MHTLYTCGRRSLIAGAAGRDFHNFNVVCRDRDEYDVVGFTATQIPDIAGRVYSALLAGELYPDGIPIRPESELEDLIREHEVDEVVFAYSDVTHEHVMHIASRALAAGASFRLLSPHDTMIASSKPVAAICAVRTGSGKSQTTRRVAQLLREDGKRVAVLRHPMPYGDLTKQIVQRFERYEDLEAADCTIEEREEYEPHLAEGNLVFAGIDYAAILEAAEREADVIVWDGGNNDTPFIRPDVHIVVVDPHRPGPAPLPPRRDEPADGERLRGEQGRQRDAGGHRRGARLDPDAQTRTRRSSSPTPPSTSRATPRRSPASACSQSRTARR